MANLMQASQQWATRPADERFTSLTAMLAHYRSVKARSRALVVPSRAIAALPDPNDNTGLLLRGPQGGAVVPTHYAFGQLATIAGAPAGYLRKLPAPIAADCINYGLGYRGEAQDVGLLLRREEIGASAQAVTGPNYGRIWNEEVISSLISRLGDGTGRDTDWSVPGEFGVALERITKANTTLYGSDRDMFVFLADEKNKIEVPNRRNGAPGMLSRGIFCWNSEVGDQTFGIATFLFDYACSNRIVWGATQYKQFKIRHTSRAPVRFVEEVAPAVESYANALAHEATLPITDAIKRAMATRCDRNGGDVNDFLANRFGKGLTSSLQAIHMAEEGKPIESLWDAATAATAYARGIQWQDERVDLERKAGSLLDLVTA
jgi:hypothetical protein